MDQAWRPLAWSVMVYLHVLQGFVLVVSKTTLWALQSPSERPLSIMLVHGWTSGTTSALILIRCWQWPQNKSFRQKFTESHVTTVILNRHVTSELSQDTSLGYGGLGFACWPSETELCTWILIRPARLTLIECFIFANKIVTYFFNIYFFSEETWL